MAPLRFQMFVSLACALGSCATSQIERPPLPPVDWQSLQGTTTTDAGPPTTSARERKLAELYLKALSSPDFVDLGPLLDEDVHFTLAGMKDVHGRGLVIKLFEELLGALRPRTFRANRVLLTQSSQIIEWTMHGVYPATAKPIELRGLSILWTSDEGSISDLHLYFDEAVLERELALGHPFIPTQSVGELETQASEPVTILEASPLGSVSSANVEVVGSALDALESRHPAAYAATMADDVELITLHSTKRIRGRDAERQYAKAMSASIVGLDATVDNAWSIDPIAVIEYHIVGEQRGSIGGKDSLVKLFIVDVVELHNGQISRIWRYDDPSQIASSPDDGQ